MNGLSRLSLSPDDRLRPVRIDDPEFGIDPDLVAILAAEGIVTCGDFFDLFSERRAADAELDRIVAEAN